MIELPLVADNAYRFNVSLDNRGYIFEITWNSLYEFYMLDILTPSEDVLIQGIKIVLNTELIRKYGRDDLPLGALIAIDTSNNLERIEFESFTTVAKLIYVPEEELSEILNVSV